MRLAIGVVVCIMVIGGCATTGGPGSATTDHPYEEKIRDWQRRVIREGWSMRLVNDILGQCLAMTTYQVEIDDHWDTPAEFIRKGFRGDCEDIAAFMMGTLRRLGYPMAIRVLAVRAPFGNHALLKVETPEGRWIVYETVAPAVRVINPAFLEPIVEFDDRTIIVAQKARN